MNKKFIQAIACVVVFMSLVSSSYAMCTSCSSDSGYNDPIIRTEFNFTAVFSGGDVVTSWVPYAPSGFNYYKVVRSTANSNPFYPEDSYIKADSNTDASGYTDTDVPTGTVYYRVCSIVSPDRYCSPVVTLNNGSVTAEKPAETVLTNANSLTLSAEMKTDGVYLTWSVDGTTPKGVKVAISTVNENPTYPVMDGDSYRYLADSATRSYKETMLTAGETYHYRVCQYDGAGKCLMYSNAVSVTVPSDYVKASVTSEYKTVVFSDSGSHLYKTAIDYLKNQAVVQGYTDGTFRPDNTINRAEFMKIVIGAKYSQDYIGVSAAWNCFSDVHAEWFAPYICIAKDEGIVGGYPDGTFRPSQYISFVEAAKILAEVYGLDFTEEETWYEGYVKALQEYNYIPSTVTRLDKSITRAEMAELIWRIKEQKKDQSYSTLIGQSVINSGDYTGWATYDGDGFSFNHPNWYQGVKWGWDLLTDEKDFIDNIGVSNYMDVDSYLSVYTDSGSDLNTTVWSDHPLVSSTELTINGVPALKRHYRAPRGTVVNGRTTGENENITVYTYRINGKVAVLQYFNAYGSENYNVETFYKIAESFVIR